MVDELEMWRCAHLLRKQKSDGAHAAAIQRAAELEAMGEARGAAVFRRIASFIIELQNETPPGSVN